MCGPHGDGPHCDLDGHVLFHVYGLYSVQYGGDLHHDVLDDGGEGGGVDGGCLGRDPQEVDFPTPRQLPTGPPTTVDTFANNFNFRHPKYKDSCD